MSRILTFALKFYKSKYLVNQRQLFLAHLAQTSPNPLALEIERAEGVFLYGKNGEKWLDLISGIGPSVLGHRHPVVQAAVEKQLDAYWHTMVYGEFVLSPQVQLSTLLTENLPGLDAVYLTSSGTEATEGAMKLAKRHTGRREIIACRFAYHGSTQGAASLMWPTDFTEAYFPLLPDIGHISFNEMADLACISEKTACVIVETIQAESGLHKPHLEWLQALRQRCTDTGTLLVFDEIQAAYGRTGHLFAFQAYGVRPDILLLAKGFGGGMPIGAFVAPAHIIRDLSHNPVLGHITTFGGHPVSAAAALATLKILLESDLMAQVPRKERLFLDLLQSRGILEVRSAGLWLAVELRYPERIFQIIDHCIGQGLLTDWFLFNDRSIRICPPLIISEDQIRWSCGVLLEAIEAFLE